jgi:phosphatidylserine/phosphatidylglycerophosphate/cardiolipin synthase-like enzyme
MLRLDRMLDFLAKHDFVAPTTEPMVLLTGDSWAPYLCRAIQAAQTSIQIAHYSISTRWNARKVAKFNVYSELLSAPKRGIRCSALIAVHKRSAATARFNATALYELSQAGWSVHLIPYKKLLHAKLFIFDGELSVLGSHNITQTASITNIDLSLAIPGREQSISFERWFNTVRSKHGQSYKPDSAAFSG